jgi:hypothetical protein
MSYLDSIIVYQDPGKIKRASANCYVCEGITLGTSLCETCAEDY